MLTRDKILASTRNLLLRQGVRSVSMDEICSTLGISKKTIYNVFSNKEEIIRGILEQHLRDEEDFIEALRQKNQDPLDEMFDIARHITGFLGSISFPAIYELKKYYRQVWEEYSERSGSFISQVIEENLRKGIAGGLYRREINPVIIAKIYIKAIMQLMEDEQMARNGIPEERLYREFIRYHLFGIVSDAGRARLEDDEFMNQVKN